MQCGDDSGKGIKGVSPRHSTGTKRISSRPASEKSQAESTMNNITSNSRDVENVTLGSPEKLSTGGKTQSAPTSSGPSAPSKQDRATANHDASAKILSPEPAAPSLGSAGMQEATKLSDHFAAFADASTTAHAADVKKLRQVHITEHVMDECIYIFQMCKFKSPIMYRSSLRSFKRFDSIFILFSFVHVHCDDIMILGTGGYRGV
jgi:hypothetical protein